MSGWSRFQAELFRRVKQAIAAVGRARSEPMSRSAGTLREVLGNAERTDKSFAPPRIDDTAAGPAARVGGSGVEIRRLEPDEWRINKQIGLAMGDSPLDFRTSVAELKRKTEEQYRADFDRLESFVAFRDGEPVGRTRLVHGPDPRALDMAAVWVSPNARGAGIGDQLMATSLGWARRHGYREVALWVRENNDHAKNLYLRAGFEPTGEWKPHSMDPSLRQIRMRLGLEE